MKLDEGSAGRVYIVERVTLELTLERRLEALGILPGTRITVLNRRTGVRSSFMYVGRALQSGPVLRRISR